MQYVFDDFLLDLDGGELLREGNGVQIERQAFALLSFLVGNSDRLISKDELVENIWDGRIVSDAAISTVIKTVRKALGDDGTRQKYIRTVHGRGFRFVGKVEYRHVQPAVPQDAMSLTNAGHDSVPARDTVGSRPSVAVLPFTTTGGSELYAAIADAIPGELISSLARLRWLHVIARGSSFRFRGPAPDFDAIGRALGASYLVTGNVELFGTSLAITAELADSRTRQVIWGDRLSGKLDDVHSMRETLVILVTSAMELHIPQHEAAAARLRSPDALDAWGGLSPRAATHVPVQPRGQ